MNKALIEKIEKDATGLLCYQSLYQRDSQCPWCFWQEVFNGNSCRKEFESPVMQQVYELILNAAGTDANVIISGESGTGKELVA